ncbi:MAG: aldolase [Candidatus Eisenbacteria bacterium]|uniref:Aldolase n=1 Tax=Eiseniibacteriota bacterium TaxID=2212470 RepID=A0A948RWB2_UNCEI|nr:aldolase [Candidatus Eisenbacteria bacterium]MBU1947716.1 aldolase [Candidatus Eisenbacteria bacterium]MBU2692040.1 aldolase [Candidatus Eisenbacteria bacterium]
MNRSLAVLKKLKQSRLIALLAPRRPEECLTAYEALNDLGIVLEIAFRTDAALGGIQAVLKRHPGALLLAGTVLTPEQADAAIRAGVAGVVSPDYLPAVVETCCQKDILCAPGGTADAGKQLVQKAELYRCDLETLRIKYPYQWLYKIFPAITGTNNLLKSSTAWKAVYKDLLLFYTGGVTYENLEPISTHDPKGIICGSVLTKLIDTPDKMREEAKRWLAVLSGAGTEAPATAPRPGEQDKNNRIEADQRVVTFGEIMLRLSPPPGRRLQQAGSFDAGFGGAEANVAVSLAQFGHPSRFVTALPENDLGQAAIQELRGLGVDTSCIVRQGNRIGLYYLEHGLSQRPSRVIYDRAGSSIAAIQSGDIDWEAALKNAAWFHWTGITPALSSSAAESLREGLLTAKKMKIPISTDINYRGKLWPREKAREVMTPLMDFVDIAIGNEADMGDVFGIHAGASDPDSGRLDIKAYQGAAGEMVEKYKLKMMAVTLRESLSASDNRWSAALFDGSAFYHSKTYSIHITDRVGAGDAFSAGLIHGILAGRSSADALEFAAAAAALKHTIAGDFNRVSLQEVEALAGGKSSGRVQR